MQVTKINDNQVRCIINKEDITSRNTNIIELFHNRDKMHSLFTDMMEEVSKEYGDAFQDRGIIMEAMVTVEGSIIVTLTKHDSKDNTTEEKMTEVNTANFIQTKKSDTHIVYSFDNLSMVMKVSNLLHDFTGENTLFKDNMNHKYYLVFKKKGNDNDINKKIYFLNEYGTEEKISEVFLLYMKEHYRIISTKTAVQSLSTINCN